MGALPLLGARPTDEIAARTHRMALSQCSFARWSIRRPAASNSETHPSAGQLRWSRSVPSGTHAIAQSAKCSTAAFLRSRAELVNLADEENERHGAHGTGLREGGVVLPRADGRVVRLPCRRVVREPRVEQAHTAVRGARREREHDPIDAHLQQHAAASRAVR